MTLQELDELYENNIKEINKLNTYSKMIIKALLQGITTNGQAYIRLSGAIEGGNKVNYTHIEGEKTFIVTIAKAIGLTVNDTTLETQYA